MTLLHADETAAAQEMMFYFGADFDMYRALAKRAAGIPGWEEHPELKHVRDFSDLLLEKMPPADTSYNV